MSAEPTSERASRVRQRRRLIEACISALHIHGPSRTTVEKVVAIAGMSPGIVRFYFDSKAAMLVAALQFLATEFEEQVLLPVARLKDEPVRALELLVELYLAPAIASPRKISVWYAFWGEATSRQEYFELCGKVDESFAALVLDLMERLIAEAREPHLDPDGVALGLIGVLEVLWQGFAYETEANIDRAAAQRRCIAYLHSVFPRHFGRLAAARDASVAVPAPLDLRGAGNRLPAAAYADAGLFAVERDGVFRAAWQFVGHEAQLLRAGDFLTLALPAERVLVVRDAGGGLRGFRNSCRRRPHALATARGGHFEHWIECAIHALAYAYDGKQIGGEGGGDLAPLETAQHAGLIFARAGSGPDTTLPAGARELPRLALEALSASRAPSLAPVGVPTELEVAADWKLVVEQWLEFSLSEALQARSAGLFADPLLRIDAASGAMLWRAAIGAQALGWTARRYADLAVGDSQDDLAILWQRIFVYPNELIELRPDGALVLQVLPDAPGRCRIRRCEFIAVRAARRERVLHYLAQRLGRQWTRLDVELAQSTQLGLAAAAGDGDDGGNIPRAVAAFRRAVIRDVSGDGS